MPLILHAMNLFRMQVPDVIRRADEALYEAKGHGRNRVALASA